LSDISFIVNISLDGNYRIIFTLSAWKKENGSQARRTDNILHHGTDANSEDLSRKSISLADLLRTTKDALTIWYPINFAFDDVSERVKSRPDPRHMKTGPPTRKGQ
jgi:hypothetical protein